MEAVARTRTDIVQLSLYADMPAASVRKLERCAGNIATLNAKGVALIFSIGRELQTAHDELANHGNGTFGKWCKERCGITDKSARNYMGVVEVFDGKVPERLSRTFTAESLYLLSRYSTPDEAIDEAVKAAESGDRIDLKRAKEIVGKYVVTSVDDAKPDDWDAEDEPSPHTMDRFAAAASDVTLAVYRAFAGWPSEWWEDIDSVFANLLKQDKATWKTPQ